MSFDLSSIVRTRQKNFFLLLIFLLLFFCPLFPPSGVQASESRISSVASPNSVGKGATSEENIDSFDVHPVNRWTITENSFTSAVATGLLNITDQGDTTADYYRLTRDLRDLSGTIETRIKWSSNLTSPSYEDAAYIRLHGAGGIVGTDGMYFYCFPDADGYSTTILTFFTADGAKSKTFSGDERIYNGLWYVVQFDYDLLESNFRIRVYFDNGSKVSDTYVHDITLIRPDIFSETTIGFGYQIQSKNADIEFLVDYVNAPFKEREWEHTVEGTDIDWLEHDSWESVVVQDDISTREDQNWTITVPRLDLFSAYVRLECSDIAAMTQVLDYVWVDITIYGVDADDGDLHNLVEWAIYLGTDGSGDGAYSITGTTPDRIFAATGLTVYDAVNGIWMSIGASTKEDRSVLAVGMMAGDNAEDTTSNIVEGFSDVDIVDYVTDLSNEFVIQVAYFAHFTDDVEFHAWFEEAAIISRDSMSEMNLGDAIARQPADTGANRIPFVSDFMDWLGSVISDLGDFLTESFEATFGSVIADLQAGLQGFFDDLGDIVDGVVDFFVAAVADFLDAFVVWFGTVLSDIWGLFEGVIFFVWDALSLPDILSVFNLLLVGFGQAVTGFGQFVTDINALFARIFTLAIPAGMIIFLFLNIPRSPTIGDWIANVFNSLMFDVTFGITIFGFGAKVPAGAVWIAIVIGSGLLSGSILGGFF